MHKLAVFSGALDVFAILLAQNYGTLFEILICHILHFSYIQL